MALTATKFERVNDSLGKGLIDFTTDVIKCMLLDSYPADTSATGHQFLADVLAVGVETAGTGYVAGGATLTGGTWTQTAGVWAYKATIPAWDTTGGALDAAFAVFYDATPGTNATNPVICVWNLDGAGGLVSSSNGSFALTQDPSGIFTLD